MPDGNTALKRYVNTIGGKDALPQSGEFFESFYPYTAAPWALVPQCNGGDVDRAVKAAHEAFTNGDWPAMTPTQRGKLLRRFGDLVAENADRLGELEVRDNGKLLAEMAAQVKYIPEWFYYYGGLAEIGRAHV